MLFGPRETPRAVKALLIANVAVFLLQLLPYSRDLLDDWAPLVPYHTFARLQLWRLVTYMFLHDTNSFFHILFNMLVLWMFGMEIENLWGTRRFAWFYFVCGAGSGLFSIVNLFNPSMQLVRVMGASGAVLGVLTVYAYYFPNRQVLLFFIVPVNIRLVVIGYALFSLFGSLRPGVGVISHLTHLGGIAVAYGYMKVYPAAAASIQNWLAARREREMRDRSETATQRKRFFEEKVDPILEKIARQGMESLTKEERKILAQASKTDKGRFKNKKIIPMDLFK